MFGWTTEGCVMRRNERGSGPITAILLMGFVALIAGVLLVTATTVARSEGSRAQAAADAAALAGAGAVLNNLPEELTQAPFGDVLGLQNSIEQPGCLQLGSASAQELAAANGASLTSYCWSVGKTQVTVTVRLNRTQGDEPAQARAVAEPGFSLSECRLAPGFTPPPSPTPTPTDDSDKDHGKGDGKDKGKDNGKGKGDDKDDAAPPPPPAPVTTSIDCGFGDLEVSFDPTTQLFTFSSTRQIEALLDDLKPRLVE